MDGCFAAAGGASSNWLRFGLRVRVRVMQTFDYPRFR